MHYSVMLRGLRCKTIISDLEDLNLNIGEVFKPNSKVVNSDGSEAECDRLYYYNKKGVFSSAKSITFDRSEGTLMANEPGTHEVVAICIDSELSLIHISEPTRPY